MASLVVLSGSAYGRVYPVAEPSCLLGRNEECQLSDIFHNFPTASRHHAEIRKVDSGYVLDDRSRHGTRLNRRKVLGPVALRHGDRISIAGIDLQFRETDAYDLVKIGQEAAELTHFTRDEEDPSVKASLSLDSSRRETPRDASRHSAEGRLQVLIELLSGLGASLELNDMLERILDGVLKVFPEAESAFIGLKQAGGELVPAAVKQRGPGRRAAVRVSRTITERVMGRREGLRLENILQDPQAPATDSVLQSGVRSGLCAPLLDSGDQPLGVLQVDTTDPASRFRNEDLVVLGALARLVTVAVQHSELHSRRLQQERTEHELEMARQVQAGLLPLAPPELDGYDFFTFYQPTYQVGGDYYDFVHMPDGRVAIIVADAAGKGVPAALMTMTVSGLLRSCLGSGQSPSASAARANCHILDCDCDGKFVTMIMAVLDPRSAEVVLVNAGHPAPFLRRNDRTAAAAGGDASSLPLGVMPNEEYQEQRIVLAQGESIVMFSDGFTDALDAGTQEFGLKRFHRLVTSNAQNTKELGSRIVEGVQQFVGTRAQIDDMCLVCFSRL